MAEYIDLDDKIVVTDTRGRERETTVRNILDFNNGTYHAADVRPVVLCRNCKHSVKGKESLECEKHRYVWNNLNRWVNDDDFCGWGVKMEES